MDESYEQLPDGRTVNRLTPFTLSRDDLQARLICQASNTHLVAPQSRVVVLDLNLRPNEVNILTKEPQITADRPYSMECRAGGAVPEATITWILGTEKIERNSSTVSRIRRNFCYTKR